MKESSSKDSSRYFIAKLLMNSLYGRFGMKTNLNVHQIIHNEDLQGFYDSKQIPVENIFFNIKLGLNNTFISYKPSLRRQNYNYCYNYVPNINISIALSVTSYARIYMSQFKNNPELTGLLYYSDTDSLFIEKPLLNKWVDNKKLGFFKLEMILSHFISLGPKVYGGIDLNNKDTYRGSN